MKHMKRILTTNIGIDGSLDVDSRALLLHRNTPSIDIGASPAELLFGRHIRDHLPKPTQFRREWVDLADLREDATMARHRSQVRRIPPLRDLRELEVSDSVAVQNQQGPRPTRWEKTGTVIEKFPDRQYRVLVDGSRRTSLRNRRFLREIPNSARNHADDPDTIPELPDTTCNQGRDDTSGNHPLTETTPKKGIDDTVIIATPHKVEQTTTLAPPEDVQHGPRRSTRLKRQPARFKDYVME